MNTDHATAEKGTANIMREWKRGETIQGLGEDAMLRWDIEGLKRYSNERKAALIVGLGGRDVWDGFDDLERAERQSDLLKGIKLELGLQIYESLTTDQ